MPRFTNNILINKTTQTNSNNAIEAVGNVLIDGIIIADEAVNNNEVVVLSQLNTKQDLLSGTGLVKSTSGTISYLTDNSNNWNSAYDYSQIGHIPLSQKSAANGVAPLGSDSKVPAIYLPSYVDDILEFANLALFPVTGELDKIYIALDTNKTYRWSGTTYVEVSPSDVNSVNGQTGIVNLDAFDVNAVPYSGALNNVNLGEYGLTTGNIKFDLTPTNIPTTQGSMYWNSSNETLDLVLNSITHKIGQDVFYHVVNQTGSTIPKGSVVSYDGTLGASGKIKVKLFIANGTESSKNCLGITSEELLNNEEGFVTAFGQIHNLNTIAYPESSVLYASPTIAGELTATEPSAPNNKVEIAYVVRSHASTGILATRLRLSSNLRDDESVLLTSLTNNDGLFYESSSQLWKNKSISTILGYTPANPANFVPYTGATGNVDLGIYDLTSDQITANVLKLNVVTAPAHEDGLLFRDAATDFLTYYNEEADIAQQIGQEIYIPVRNNSGATIPNGSVVYITGSVGLRPTIALAQANSLTTSKVAGVTTHAIENNTNGYITVIGVVNNLNTSAFTAGDELFLSETTPGAFTNVKPSGTNFAVVVGSVLVSNPSVGNIKVSLRPTADSAQRSVAQTITGQYTFTNSIISSHTGNVFLSANSGGSSQYLAQIINTNGTLQLGVAGSLSPFFTGGTNGAAALGTSSTIPLEFGTSNITRYSISSGGNHDFKSGTAAFGGDVGIGVSPSGSYKLDVNGVGRFKSSAQVPLILDNTGQQYTQLDFRNSGTYKSAIYWDNTANKFILANNGIEAISIGTTGSTTVTGAGVTLWINSSNSNTYKMLFQDNGTIRSYIGASTSDFFTVADSSVVQKFSISSDGYMNSYILGGAGDRLAYVNNAGKIGALGIGSGLAIVSGNLTATGGSAGTISGSGTAGYLTKFTGSGSVGNSIMTESGSTILINGSAAALRVGSNSGDYGLITYSGGVVYLENAWASTSAYTRITAYNKAWDFQGNGNLMAPGYISAASGFYTSSFGTYMLPSNTGWQVQSPSASLSRWEFKTSDGVTRGFMGCNNTGVVGGIMNAGGSYVWYVDATGYMTAASGGFFNGTVTATSFTGAGTGLTGTASSLTAGAIVSQANSATITASTSITGSTIAQRTSDGYLYASYFNQNSSNNEAGTISQIMYTNGTDGFFRKAGVSQMQSFLGLGSNAYSSTSYLPLSGGTLSGALAGTSASFSSSVTASGGFFNSDINLKNIFNYSLDLFDLKSTAFTWKKGSKREDGNKTHYGYVAQEVEKYLPDAVTVGEDGYKSVNYAEVHTVKIQQLEDKIKRLEILITKLGGAV